MNSKDTLIKEIVNEINGIPIIYLKTLYALIHSFKETIPIPDQLSTELADNFNWDELLEEIHSNRNKTNQHFQKRTSVLFGE